MALCTKTLKLIIFLFFLSESLIIIVELNKVDSIKGRKYTALGALSNLSKGVNLHEKDNRDVFSHGALRGKQRYRQR